jgi:hypothetical protein
MEVGMIRKALVLVVLLVGLGGADTARLAAQKQQQLFLSLVEPSGAPITDLQMNEVTIMEDGVECKTLKLEPINWPIKLQVLVDNGQAVTNPITSLRSGLHGLFDAIPDGIEISMFAIAPQPRPVVRPTTDKQKVVAGIDLIAPDNGAGAFFDALSEAASRIDKDKSQHFPVILLVGSDFGRSSALDRDFQKLQENIIKHAVTVHIVMVSAGGTRVGSVAGAGQTEIGLAVTKLSGGRYENIAAASRLATLLPELGQHIADSHRLQSHQYRLTYERPPNAKPMPTISASISHPGNPVLTIDGHIP